MNERPTLEVHEQAKVLLYDAAGREILCRLQAGFVADPLPQVAQEAS